MEKEIRRDSSAVNHEDVGSIVRCGITGKAIKKECPECKGTGSIITEETKVSLTCGSCHGTCYLIEPI